MKKKIITFAVMLIFTATIFSGCNEQQKTNSTNNNTNNNQLDIGMTDGFSVGTAGGEFSLFNDAVEVNVLSGSVSEYVNITVETINNPVTDPSLYLFSCFDFGPDGLTFERPIDVIIHYNVGDLPAGFQESTIKVYVLNGTTWEPLEGSFANQIMHYAVAQVSHFSKMAGGGAAASNGDTDEDDDEGSDDEGNSSQYWFKANLNYYNYKDLRLVDWDDDNMYTYGVSAYWDPVPYVQYYQIKFEFHNNPPTTAYAWGCDYREQGEPYCSMKTPYNKVQGYIYHVGGDPNLDGYLTLYDTNGTATAGKYNQDTGEMEYYTYGRIFPEGKHGFAFFGVYDTIEDIEGLTDYEIGVVGSQMEGFVQGYTDSWDVWVRAVTESGN